MQKVENLELNMGEESRPVILNNDNYGSSILSIQINEAITLVWHNTMDSIRAFLI